MGMVRSRQWAVSGMHCCSFHWRHLPRMIREKGLAEKLAVFGRICERARGANRKSVLPVRCQDVAQAMRTTTAAGVNIVRACQCYRWYVKPPERVCGRLCPLDASDKVSSVQVKLTVLYAKCSFCSFIKYMNFWIFCFVTQCLSI